MLRSKIEAYLPECLEAEFSEVRYPQATPKQRQRYAVWAMCHA
jgi:hypothetical protein